MEKSGGYFKPKSEEQRKAIVESIKMSDKKEKEEIERLRKITEGGKRKMKKRFRHGDEVELIGNKNPFEGEIGEFHCYEKKYVDKERLIVFLYSDRSEHYFYPDEVIMKTPYSERIFPVTNMEANRFKTKNEVKGYEMIFKLQSGNWVYSNGKKFLVEDEGSFHQNSTPLLRDPTNKETQVILAELRFKVWRQQ